MSEANRVPEERAEATKSPKSALRRDKERSMNATLTSNVSEANRGAGEAFGREPRAEATKSPQSSFWRSTTTVILSTELGFSTEYFCSFCFLSSE